MRRHSRTTQIRLPIATSFFALVVVRKDDRILMVQEAKYGNTWTVPGGRVEPGELLESAARREVLEECGVPVHLEGIARLEHSINGLTARLRVIYVGTPADDTPPKSIPDIESLRADYLTLDEIRALSLRGSDLLALLEQLTAGMPLAPLSFIGRELSI